MRIVTTLPHWLPAAGTPDSLAQQWTRFLDATLVHERGHRNIALHTAVAILHTLQEAHEAECPGISDIANLHAHAALGSGATVATGLRHRDVAWCDAGLALAALAGGSAAARVVVAGSRYGEANTAAGADPAAPFGPTATRTSRSRRHC